MSDTKPSSAPVDGAGGFPANFVEQALPIFGRNALWLLIAIIHHGWRAHVDAVQLLVGERPSEGAPDEAWHAFEHRSLAALEEIFMLVDQLYRLVRGVRAHRGGKEFLDAYCEHVPSLRDAYEELKGLCTDDWASIVPIPDRGAVVKWLEKMKVPDTVAAEILETALGLHELCVKNMSEIAVFFERVPSPIPGITNCSLRDMNNEYRHGTRVLYGDCDPAPTEGISTNPVEKAGVLLPADQVGPAACEETVDVLIKPPGDDGRAQTAKARFSVEWCESFVRAAANLGVLMRRLAAGFLRTEVDGQPSCAALAPFHWAPLQTMSGEVEAH